MANFAPLSLDHVVQAVGGNVVLDRTGGSAMTVAEIGEPLDVGSGGVAFVISESFIKDVPQTKAGVLVIQESFAERVLGQLPESVRICVASKDAYLGLANFTKLIADNDPLGNWRLSTGASIADDVQVGPRSVILPNVVIGPGVTIGADCQIFPGVVIYPRTQIGNRVRLHANVVLGSDGFGYARGPKGSVKIWHLGRVRVEDDVEIGAGTMVDRGTLKDTVIGQGAKIDNLVQIGHNGHVKAHAILCAQVGMAGNVTVGKGAILAGKAGIADKIEIGDGALVGPMTGVSKDVEPGEQVMGHHMARPRREWWRLLALFDRLPELYERVKKLEGKPAKEGINAQP